MKILILILGIIFVQNSFATGETMCEVNIKNIKMDIYTLNSRLPGNPVLDAAATVEIVGNKADSVIFLCV